MTFRFLADACFPRPTVHKLRRLGHDVEIIQVIEGTSRPAEPLEDHEILDLAISMRRAVLTLNAKHFVPLHAAVPGHKGIVLCKSPPDLDFKKQAKEIDACLKNHTNLAGRLIHIPPKEGEAEP